MSKLNSSDNGGFQTTRLGDIAKIKGAENFFKAGVLAAMIGASPGVQAGDEGTKSVSFNDWCKVNAQECSDISSGKKTTPTVDTSNQVSDILKKPNLKSEKNVEFGSEKTKSIKKPSGVFTPGLVSDDGKSGVLFNPSESQVSTKGYIESENVRVEAELKSAINGINDTRVKAQLFMLLDTAKQYGAYIGYEKATEFSMFSLSGAMKVEGGKIKVSAGFLDRMMKFDFSEFNKSFEKDIKQSSFGIDYTKEFDHKILRELKTSLTYHSSKNQDFGVLGNKITDNSDYYEWSEVSGGVRGGDATIVDLEAKLKVSENIRVTPNIGVEQLNYNTIGNISSKTKSSLTGGVGVTYQPDKFNKFDANANLSQSGDKYSARYGHQLGNGVEGFVEASHTSGVNGMKDENRIFAGIKASFGGPKASQYTPLFNDGKKADKLVWADLNPNYRVVSEQIKVIEKVTWEDRIVYIDKSNLLPGDTLDKNADGTLKSLMLDNGGFTISSINAISDSSYSPYIQVISGQLAIVDFKGLNNLMSSQGIQEGQTKTINLSVNDTSGVSIYGIDLVKGSVEISSVIKRLFNLDPALAAEFVSGVKTFEQVKEEKENAVNKTILNNTILTAQGYNENDYTQLSWLNLQTALTVAIALKNSSIATQAQVNIAVIELQAAINGLVIKDLTPNVFAFTSLTNQVLNTVVTTNTITVAGINQSVTASTTVGTIIKNGVDTGSNSTTVSLGDTVAIKLTTSGSYSTTINGTVTIGTGTTSTSNFSVTTINPPPPEVPPVMGDVPNQTYTSGTAITNLNMASYVTATNGDAIISYTLTGTLPTGLIFNSTTGVLSGTPTQTGTFNMSIVSTDNDGVSNSDAFTITVDNLPAPTGLSISGTTLSWNSVSGANIYQVCRDGGASCQEISAPTTNFTLLPIHNGKTLFVQSALNSGGPRSPASNTVTYTISVDTTLPATPTLSINSGANYTNSTTVSLSITGDTDNVGVTGWFASESSSVPSLASFGSEPATMNISTGDGTKTIYIRTRDAAGNISLAGSDTIILDTIAPSNPLFTSSVPNLRGTNYTVSVQLTDTLSGLSTNSGDFSITSAGSISGISVSGNVLTFSYTTPNASSDTLLISGKDNAGNTFTNLSLTVPSLNLAPPSGLSYTSPILSWSAVPGATSYIITDGNNTRPLTGTSVNITDIGWIDIVTTGPIDLYVIATDGTNPSSASLPITISN